MEVSEDLSIGGVTVVGSDAPSDYHVAPRTTENPTQVSGSKPPEATAAGGETAGAGATLMKKKRGRPRKYGPDGSFTVALSPKPISTAAPSPVIDFSAEKRGKVRPAADVTMKIISFSQQGPRAICILSANGVISSVTLRQPDSSGGTLTYEGRFEILSLTGSFMPSETGGMRNRSGGMSVSLASPDGRVVGGGVAGLLVAAGPVQVVVGSFIAGNQHEQKAKKHKPETVTAAIPISSAEMEDPYHASPKPIMSSAPSFRADNWSALAPADSRNKPTDINVTLPA